MSDMRKTKNVENLRKNYFLPLQNYHFPHLLEQDKWRWKKKKKRLKTKPKPTATAVGIPGPAIMYFRAASTYPW